MPRLDVSVKVVVAREKQALTGPRPVPSSRARGAARWLKR
jgi:hypothetical protein